MPCVAALALLTALALAGPGRALGAPEERCFQATGYCISGEIARFWDRHGGLAVFGFPITPLQPESIEGQPLEVQWFERHRLELHPGLPAAYRVQIGRLGVEQLLRQGRATAPGAGGAAGQGCRSFAETGHQVCGEFLKTWRALGAESDGRPGLSDSERMALFGLPLTGEQPEQLGDGRSYTVQWFERARMELHPELSPHPQVLFGRLGAELGPRPAAPPRPGLVQPVRIVIPTIALDATITPTGLDAAGVPVVPKHEVGWYSLSAAPGEGENVVLWGHVLRFTEAPQIPAPFARVKQLGPGDQILIQRLGGDVFSYVVERQIWARPDEVRYVLPQGRELLTMISCIGEQVIVDGEVIDMSHRLVTVARPSGP